MTVNTTANVISYNGNGSTTLWNFPFPMVDKSFIVVSITDPIIGQFILPSNAYVVTMNAPISPNPTSVGGTVLLLGPPLAVGKTITIVRVLPAVQDTSIGNQSVIYPPVIEQALDYLTLLIQGRAVDLDRSFKVPIGDPFPEDVPPVALRANQSAFFDANGNLVPGQIPGPGAFISAAMQPVVAAITIQDAQIAFGLGPSGYSAISGAKTTVTSTYVVLSTDKGRIIELKGNAYYTVTVGSAASYPADFQFILYNNDPRGKLISISGEPAFILWPQQSTYVIRDTSGGWFFNDPRRWHPSSTVTYFVDFNLGNDANDGLATGNQAFKTIQQAVDTVERFADGVFVIQLANGTHATTTGVLCRVPIQNGYTIQGNAASPQAVIVTTSSGGVGFLAVDNVVMALSNMKIGSSSLGVIHSSVEAIDGAVIVLNNVSFGPAAGGGHIIANQHSTVTVLGSYHIQAGISAGEHVFATNNSFISYQPTVVTLDGNVVIDFFVYCVYCSVVSTAGTPPSFPGGTNAGVAYNVSFNAVAYFNGGLPPGTAGSTSGGGIWIP